MTHPYPPLRPRHAKPMNRLSGTRPRKLAGTLKTLTTRFRAWKMFPEGARRRRSNYDEKQLFGDDKDYDEDDEEDDSGYVLVKKPCAPGACAGERRADVSAWEYGSRRMML